MPSATPSRLREGNLTIALIDYGAGNLRSVHNALLAAGAQDVAVTADPDIVAKADRIVLPGVGAFAACMNGLSAISGLVGAMERRRPGRGAALFRPLGRHAIPRPPGRAPKPGRGPVGAE